MARFKYPVPEHLQCQQPNRAYVPAYKWGRGSNPNCERRATYIDDKGYRYCTQHTKEPATTLRKATGRIRSDLRSFNPTTGKVFEGAPLPQRATEEAASAEGLGTGRHLHALRDIDRIVGGIIDAYELAPNDEDEKREAVARQVRAALEWSYRVGNEDAVNGFRL